MAKTEEKIEKERKWSGIVLLVIYIALFAALIYSNYSCKKNHEQLTGIISECVSENGEVTGIILNEGQYVIECEKQGYDVDISGVDETFS